MRQNRLAECACQGRNLLPLGESTRTTKVQLHNIYAILDQVAKTVSRKFALAACNRDVERAAHLLVPGMVFRRYRLLEPQNLVALDSPTQSRCRSGVVGVIGIDH